MPDIPAGRYKARAIEATLGLTNGNKEQVGVLFEILEGDQAGARITWYGYFHGTTPEKGAKNAKRTLESLRACGWKGDDLTNLDGVTECEVELQVERDTYEGKERAKVAWVNKIGGIAMKSPLTGGAAQAFAAKMRGLAMSVKAEVPEPPPVQTPQQAMGIQDDDIPF
jgi:hypothetical protein